MLGSAVLVDTTVHARELFDAAVTDAAIVSRDGWVIHPSGLYHELGPAGPVAGSAFHWLEVADRQSGDDVVAIDARLVALEVTRGTAERMSVLEHDLNEAKDKSAHATAAVRCGAAALAPWAWVRSRCRAAARRGRGARGLVWSPPLTAEKARPAERRWCCGASCTAGGCGRRGGGNGVAGYRRRRDRRR